MSAFVVAALVLALLLDGIGLAIFGVIALLGAVLGIVEYFTGYATYRRDLDSGVASIQGQLHYVQRGNTVLNIEPHPSGIRVGDETFLLLELQVEAFTPGAIYVLYYAPRTHTLLSAEKVFSDLEDEAADHGLVRSLTLFASERHQPFDTISELATRSPTGGELIFGGISHTLRVSCHRD